MNISTQFKIAIYSIIAFVAIVAIYGFTRGVDGRTQSTDDAYVSADYTLVAPRVRGVIAEVLVQDNQAVHVGQLLARLDDRDYQAALDVSKARVESAQGELATLQSRAMQQQAMINQAEAAVMASKANVVFARHNYARYTRLARQGAGTLQNAQQAQAKIETASAHLRLTEAKLDAAKQQVSVLQSLQLKAMGGLAIAQASLEKAKLNMAYTRITSPIDGIIGHRALRVGAFVQPGTPLLAVVPVSKAYIIANFRETQLSHVKPGQPVHIDIDMYPGIHFHGIVDSIAPATGLSFSPLAPINATGNFTKIVQRIPVKIALQDGRLNTLQLRPGMSADVTIDTRTHGLQRELP